MIINAHITLQKMSPDKIASLSPIRDIYESSFPADERRVFDLVVKLTEKNPDFNFYAILRDDEPIGLLSFWNLDHFIFVEHFAISPKYRGWGIGQEVFQSWSTEQSLPVVLEVEKPEDDISRRRIGFYERVGFRLWHVDYLQPAYAVNKNPVPLYLMAYGNIDLNKTLDNIRQQLYQRVYMVSPTPSG